MLSRFCGRRQLATFSQPLWEQQISPACLRKQVPGGVEIQPWETLLKPLATSSSAGTDGATSVKAEVVGRLPIIKDAASFRAARRMLTEELGGMATLKEELNRSGFIDPVTGNLTTGTRPFNVLLALVGGVMTQPGMDKEQEYLQEFKDHFIICSNLPANDEHWDSDDKEWVGKASMSKRHRFLTCKDLHWQWFNVLGFGLLPESKGGAGPWSFHCLSWGDEGGGPAVHFSVPRMEWPSGPFLSCLWPQLCELSTSPYSWHGRTWSHFLALWVQELPSRCCLEGLEGGGICHFNGIGKLWSHGRGDSCRKSCSSCCWSSCSRKSSIHSNG